jgi:hypothetical protein
MAESHTLADPVIFPAPPQLTDYRVIRFFIDRSTSEAQLLMAVRSNTDVVVEARYSGAAADTLIAALNTANLSIKSLQRRVLERMVADGFLAAGSVTGTPD